MPKGQHSWYTPEEKMNIVQSYYSSQLTVGTFCKEQKISRATLYKWLKIYNEATAALPTQGFQDITPIIKQDVEQIIKSTSMKLKLPNDIILEFDSSELHKVLMELI